MGLWPTATPFDVRYKLQVLLDFLGQIGGVLGNGDGDVHIVGLCEGGAPDHKLIGSGSTGADGLVQVVDVYVGNIEVAGVQARQQALEHISVADAVLFGVHQANAVVQIESQLLAVLDANDIALSGLQSVVDGVDELLGLAGALEAENNMNHGKFLLFG